MDRSSHITENMLGNGVNPSDHIDLNLFFGYVLDINVLFAKWETNKFSGFKCLCLGHT